MKFFSRSADAAAQFRANPRRQMAQGTLRVFLGEALMLPTGLITAAFLTRKLAPVGYGSFTVAATLVAWIEWSITAMFARASYKIIGEAADWRPAGTAIARLYTGVGIAAAAVLWLLAGPVSDWLKEPSLGGYLRLFAIDIPIFTLAQAHRMIMVGTGDFRGRAVVTAVRWIARLLFIVVLVQGGLSISGAILGSIGASIVELIFCRFYVQPGLLRSSTFPVRQLWISAGPLLLYALSMRVVDKLDLILLQGLRGRVSEAGVYGAAQNLTLLSGLFAIAFTPLLQSTLTRLLRDDKLELARRTGYDAVRVVIGMLPFAAIVSGAATDISIAVFGDVFRSAGVPLSLLIFSSIGFVAIAVVAAILIAVGKTGATAGLTVPLVFAALTGHFLLIPSLGMYGAALVTTVVAGLGALAAMIVVDVAWQVKVPVATFLRSGFISAGAYLASVAWPASGFVAVTIKLCVLGLLVPGAFFLLGEFDVSERRAILGTLRRGRSVVAQHAPL
jgi:O-antigen/teichoic acid export membrane protein